MTSSHDAGPGPSSGLMGDVRVPRDNDEITDIIFGYERTFTQGFDEGFQKANSEKDTNSAKLGKVHGQKVGLEVGVMLGVAKTTLCLGDSCPQVSSKTQSTAKQLMEICEEIIASGIVPQDPLFTELDKARQKYRFLCAQLKIAPVVEELKSPTAESKSTDDAMLYALPGRVNNETTKSALPAEKEVSEKKEGTAPKKWKYQEKQKLREVLTPMQFHVTQEKGTERQFSGKYVKFDETGLYHCIVCNEQLFDSEAKYQTSCGWASFARPIQSSSNGPAQAKDKSSVIEAPDFCHGLARTEVKCAKCGAHIGHVFDDGPKKLGGLRYCVNSVALDFKPKNEMCTTEGQTGSTS